MSPGMTERIIADSFVIMAKLNMGNLNEDLDLSGSAQYLTCLTGLN